MGEHQLDDLLHVGLGIDPDNHWEAQYQILPGKEKVVNELKKLAADADAIYLATDLDREGEAIAWHLREAIGGERAAQAEAQQLDRMRGDAKGRHRVGQQLERGLPFLETQELTRLHIAYDRRDPGPHIFASIMGQKAQLCCAFASSENTSRLAGESSGDEACSAPSTV